MASHYQSKHAAPSETSPQSSRAPKQPDQPSRHNQPKGRLPLVILALVLCFCIIGAGAYALVHYVIFAPSNTSSTETLPPAPTEPTLAPTPTAAPTQAPTEPGYTSMADELLRSMSTREKICQLFIVTPETLTGVDGVNIAGETTRQALADYPVGGIIYNTANLESVEQTSEMIEKSQEFVKIPLFISVDEEGGQVARVAERLGTTSFDPMYSYKDQGVQVAYDNALTIASEISAIGFNLDFAPVADVWSNPSNTVIATRAYSDSFEQAAQLIGRAVKGFADGGVLCTLKHFPGHGGTTEDSHAGLAYVRESLEELKAGALLPFKSGIDAGADMVMIGHLVVAALDDELPATLSGKVVPQLLREYLGYDGVVITDGMQMNAITDNYDHDTIVKGIFDADVDIILQPDSLDSYITAIENALDNGTITQAQLDSKVRRILTLKYSKGIIPTASTNAE